ncbi:MAG: hypothetical protein ACXVPN_09365 [Bacteroidia bacterium]
MKRKLSVAFFVLALLFLGFFREYVFIWINAILYNKYIPVARFDTAPIRPEFEFLTNYSYNTLYTIKWFITAVFLLAFWLTQKKLLMALFSEKKTNRWLGVMYLSLLLLAGISFFAGWVIGYIHEGYRFSRIFMGLAESPVPCMILIPLTYFYKNYNSEI